MKIQQVRKSNAAINLLRVTAMWVCVALLVSACSTSQPFGLWTQRHDAPSDGAPSDYNYIIGPGDNLSVFVWRNPELTTTVAVRPDGKFSTPLVEDLQASGKTPTELAREIEKKLSDFIRDPLVTITIGGFQGEYDQQVRVVGEATKPQAIPYRKDMTLLDVMVQVGGLTEFAAGNRSTLVRHAGNGRDEFRVRLDDLIKDGDIEANVPLQPGDILIVPEAWF